MVDDYIDNFFPFVISTKDDDIGVTYIASECLRKSFYEMTIEREYTPELEDRLLTGKLFHLIPVGLEFKEVSVRWNGIIGVVDDYGKVDGEWVIVDKKFGNYRQDKDEPNPHHVRQVEYYKALFEKVGYPVDRGYLLYFNPYKPGFEPFVFEVKMRETEEIVEEMIERRDILRSAVKGDLFLPEPKYSWLCRYCEFSYLCLTNVREVKKDGETN